MNLPRRFWERSGPALMSPEIPHIYREPPKSVWTRKKERVTEADTTWTVRPDGPASDSSRINQAIREYARGINPSVEVEYQNRGKGSQTLYIPNKQAGSTYKLDVVRPPLFPVETLLPLSRPRTHQNKSVETNPGLPQDVASATLFHSIDWNSVENAVADNDPVTIPISTTATAYYKIEEPQVMNARYAINDNSPMINVWTNPSVSNAIQDMVSREITPYGTIVRPKTEAKTNPKLEGYIEENRDASNKVKQANLIVENVKPNFQIVVYDPKNHVATEVSANIRQKTNIAINAALSRPIQFSNVSGEKILARKYQWTAVTTNVGLDQVILTLEDPNIELERNVPLYASATNFSTPSDVLERVNQDYDLEGKISANTTPSYFIPGENDQAFREQTKGVRLRTPLEKGSFSNQTSSIPTWDRTEHYFSNEIRSNNVGRNASSMSWNRTQDVY